MSAALLDNMLTVVLVLIMFAIGSTLTLKDFRRTFYHIPPLLVGLGLQLVFLPLFVFAVVYPLSIPVVYKVGFVVLSLCPGGATSNFISYLVNADVALSVSLTTINSLIILITIPIGTNLALDYFMSTDAQVSLSMWDTLKYVIGIIVVPSVLGLAFNLWRPEWSRQLRLPLKVVNSLLLGLVYLLKAIIPADDGGVGLEMGDLYVLVPMAVVIQVGSMLVSYFIARWLVKRPSSTLTIGVEVGLQNTTLALLITTVMIGDAAMGKPAVVITLFSFFTTILFAYVVYRWVVVPYRRSLL